MTKNKLAVAFLLMAVPLTGWLFYFGAESRQGIQSPTKQEGLSEALNIEPVTETPAPDFVLRDMDGKTVRLHDMKGKVVLLNFWATWCPSCRFEMPSMELLHREYGERGLVVLAVAFQDSADDVRSFYQEHNLSFPALLDNTAGASELYKTWSLPTTFIINKRGNIVGRAIGYRDWQSEPAKTLFSQLLEESA